MPLYAGVAVLLALAEITILGSGGNSYYGCGMLPLYVLSWVLPAVSTDACANEIESNRWASASLSRLRTSDLWVAYVIAPVLPWLLMAMALAIPLFGIANDPGRLDSDVRIRDLRLYFTHVTPWAIQVGIVACAVAYSSVAVMCAFRMRRLRSSVVATYMSILATTYFAIPIALLLGANGGWASIPALRYALQVEPWCLAAPPWIVGATMYGFGGVVDAWIVPLTALMFVCMAFVLTYLSYRVVANARGHDVALASI